MSKKIHKLLITITLSLIGAAAGYLYFRFVGCNGACFIWSSPYVASAYGALLGGLSAGFIPLRKTSKKEAE